VRVAVTLLLLGLLTWHLDLSQIASSLRSFDAAWLAASFVVVLAAIVVSAWKWGLILRARGQRLPYTRLLRHYFVGLFFNNVLPTSVGGDAVRAWATTQDTGETPEAVGSVVSERLIAGVALGITALVGLPFVEGSSKLVVQVLAFLAIDFALVSLFLLPKVAESIVGKLVPKKMQGLHAQIAATVVVVRETLWNWRLFIKIAAYSVAFQILVAAVNACLFQALGVQVSLAQCVIYTPMIFTITMLPISISGFGVREAAYWYFFSQVGVGQAEAIAASLLFFVVVGICSLPGAPLFVFGRKRLR
jgi:uncharacterized protein (TIRG00374 family)